jgi:hypothetical protein
MISEACISTRPRGLRAKESKDSAIGISQLLRVARSAAFALIVCSPMFLQARPRTPLRVFCIAGFEYLARLKGDALGRRRRVAIAHACDFGSLRDEYYDEKKLDLAEYRSLRAALRTMAPESAAARYIQQLRHAERTRPILSPGRDGLSEATINYRATVISLSLRWMQKISGVTVDRAKFHSIVSLVCLMQLLDDVLDWKEDLATSCPSYVTAFLLDRRNTDIKTALRAQADALLRRTLRAARQDADAFPFAFAGLVTWTFVVALIKVRSLK